jgi:hypothetical protein
VQADVRLSSAGAAVAVKMFFQGRGLQMKSEEAGKVVELSAEGGDAPLEAVILDGEREKAFWAKVDVNDRDTSYSKMQHRQQTKPKRAWNGTQQANGRASDGPSKHRRFD